VKIYTKTGDDGTTGLLGGTRVAKDHPRVVAYGEVDELNALLGVTRAEAKGSLAALLGQVQRDLLALGAQLADPTARLAGRKAKAALSAAHVRRLERAIDHAQKGLPPLTAFILPGGSSLAAHLHLARTVCRRAERALVTLARDTSLDRVFLVYLNRLSDLLFVLARRANREAARPDETW
jgi:cob(I)alamin adenosyltransferase